MERKGLARFAPLTGVLFTALAVTAFAIGDSNAPDNNSSPAKQLHYWTTHDSKHIAAAIIASYAALMLLWFAGSLREAIARTEPQGSRLASLAFGGAVVFATGLLVDNALEFAVADTAGDLTPQATQALAVTFNEFFLPLAIGNALFLLAAGLASVRYRALPRWLGWIAIVLGVVSLTPVGWVAFLLGLLWIGVAGVVLFIRRGPVGAGAGGAAGPTAPPPAAPEAPVAPA
ncbi:MAG: hypothetical protein QOE06_882 [Thermoleophilaceae bacterium]|jgi:hypothetical protein|nr:hypothetical protein [Thermoleophilaceae bacterium]